MNATRANKGAGNEKRSCHMCHAQVYFARDGSEEICRDWGTGRPHQETCTERQPAKPPTSIHRDAKPSRGAAEATAKLITFYAPDRIVIRPRGGGAMEITLTATGYNVRMARTPGSTGVALDPEEVKICIARLDLHQRGIALRRLWESCQELDEDPE